MKDLKSRWKAPTPKKWKRIMYTSMMLSAGAVVILNAERVGGIVIPGFKFTLLSWSEIMFKYIFLAGIVSAAISKFQKENPHTDEDIDNNKTD